MSNEIKEKNAVISYRQDVTPELIIIKVRPDSGEVPDFTPGQYAELAVPQRDEASGKLIRRSYSIASSPNEKSALELYIVLVPEGTLTPDLIQLPKGGRVWLGPKIKGKFTLDDLPPKKDLVCIATGTGIAPFISMLRYYTPDPPWNSFTLIHGVRYAAELGYHEELLKLQESHPWFRYLASITRETPKESSGLQAGRIQHLFQSNTFEKLSGQPLNPDTQHFLLCGNPAMIDEMTSLLSAEGFKEHKKKDPGNIHFERYW